MQVSLIKEVPLLFFRLMLACKHMSIKNSSNLFASPEPICF